VGADAGDPLEGQPEVRLPADHSFVLQFRPGSGAAPSGPWTGRVEHVVSGRSMRFDDCSALCAFIARILQEVNDG